MTRVPTGPNVSFRTSAVYRPYRGELWVFAFRSDFVFRFNLATRDLLDFFRDGRSIDDYIASAGLNAKESLYLDRFTQQLSSQGIVESAERSELPSSKRASPYQRPLFLGRTERNLAEMVLLWGISNPPSSQTGQ